MNLTDFMKNSSRNRLIIKYSLIGIAINLFLFTGKLAIGLIINAHAIILDGLNSLSDFMSAIISIFSAKIGGKRADKSHPFGFGRMEYVCSMVITAGVIFVGIQGLINAVSSIIHPHEAPRYNTLSIIIMVISFISKLSYGLIMRHKGQKINSTGMILTGIDSMGDSLIAGSILAGILIYKLLGVDIEHYLCIIIALFIIKTGLVMAGECVTNILGTGVKPEFKKELLNLITAEDGVLNVCNLVIHKYGEEVNVGAVDIEVDENMKASDINKLTLRIKKKALDHGVTLTSVGITGTNTQTPEAVEMWDRVIEIARKHPGIMRVHSFVYDPNAKIAAFFVVHDYSDKDYEKTKKNLMNELYIFYPEYTFIINSGINV